MATVTTEPVERRAPLTRRRSRLGDPVFRGVALAVGLGLIALLIMLIVELATGSSRVFAKFGLSFLTGRNWNPVAGRESFGALPFIFGTLVTSAIAVALAVPVAVGCALLVNEIPSGWLRNPMIILVDLLAAIPSIVYGLWGLLIMLPLFEK